MRPAALKRTKSSVGDYSGTNVLVGAGVRNSWNVWRLLNTPDMLAPKVASFITKHEDALAQEERWRAKIHFLLGVPSTRKEVTGKEGAISYKKIRKKMSTDGCGACGYSETKLIEFV